MSHVKRRVLAGGLAAITAAGAYVGFGGSSTPATAEQGARTPIVIGHRGASGLRPEHTRSSYKMAISQGADFIEPDVVSTKDHALVARHDNWLADTTDVENHPEFAGRKTTKTIDGVAHTDWFTEDFTLAELHTLRTEERIPALRPNNAVFNGLDQIPTVEEVLQLSRANNVGVYPETKHPTYFDGLGLSLEEPLVALLNKYGFEDETDKVFIQSFETANLRELRTKTKVRLIQLIDSAGAPYDFVASGDPRTYNDLVKPSGLRFIASYADAIGPNTSRIVPMDAAGKLGGPTTLIRDAHRLRLDVHTWTIRGENQQLPADYRQGDPKAPGYERAIGNVPGWLAQLYKLGVNGVFCDDPSTGVSARTEVFGA
jgi:glycerophosphoryl diester phosphodiesterase